MERRQALKLLTALPAVASIEVATLTERDVIVVECDLDLTETLKAHINESLREVWPNQKIVIFDKGIHMRITRDAVKA